MDCYLLCYKNHKAADIRCLKCPYTKHCKIMTEKEK